MSTRLDATRTSFVTENVVMVVGMAPPSSRVVAVWMRHADQMWFGTALRKRLPDSERQEWKDRFVARSISLRARWRNMSLAANLDEVDIDGHVDDSGIRYVGKAKRQKNGKYIGLAQVGQALCRVEITLTPNNVSQPRAPRILASHLASKR